MILKIQFYRFNSFCILWFFTLISIRLISAAPHHTEWPENISWSVSSQHSERNRPVKHSPSRALFDCSWNVNSWNGLLGFWQWCKNVGIHIQIPAVREREREGRSGPGAHLLFTEETRGNTRTMWEKSFFCDVRKTNPFIMSHFCGIKYELLLLQ